MRALPRVVTLVVVGGALAGGLLVDRDRPAPEPPATFGRAVQLPMAVVPSPDAVSTSWYCPGVPTNEDGTANGEVNVVNVGTTTAQVVVHAVPADPAVDVADPKRFDLVVGARQDVRVAELAPAPPTSPAPFAGAVVEVFGGLVVAEQTVIGGEGRDTTPCAREASGAWYLADGVTTDGATLTYTVLNPFPDAAVLDVTLATDRGPAEPQALQGFVVPGRSMRTIVVGDHVRDRAQVAAALVARTGRVVVGRIQTFGAPDPRRGLASSPGAPSLSTDHVFTSIQKADGVDARLVVYNPGESEAVSLVELRPVGGVDPALGEPEPLELTVPARSAATLDLATEETVAPGLYVATVRSSNGVPIAVERVVDRSPATGVAGHAVTVGSTLAAARWVVALGATAGGFSELVEVANPTDEAVTFTVTGLDGAPLGPGLVDVPVGPFATTTVDLGVVVQQPQLGVVVVATGDVVVQRDLAGGPPPNPAPQPQATSQSPGVPYEPVVVP